MAPGRRLRSFDLTTDSLPYVIEQDHCLHCGACLAACPTGAAVRR